MITLYTIVNLKHRINLWRKEEMRRWLLVYNILINAYCNFMLKIEKLTFEVGLIKGFCCLVIFSFCLKST